MSDEHGGELPADWPSDVIAAEEAGVRVFWVSADTMQGLVDRLAVVLGEHMSDGDDLHVTYNAMQSGWENHAPRKGNLVRSPEPGWTELRFRVQRLRRAAHARPAAGRRQGMSASPGASADRLRVDPCMFDAPCDVPSAIIAHEPAHLALSHRGPARRRTSILAGVVAATVVGAVSLVPCGWNLMAPTVLGAATLLLGLRWVGRRWGK